MRGFLRVVGDNGSLIYLSTFREWGKRRDSWVVLCSIK
jgi:hypothetical protein